MWVCVSGTGGRLVAIVPATPMAIVAPVGPVASLLVAEMRGSRRVVRRMRQD